MHKELQIDRLRISIHDDSASMGSDAADFVVQKLGAVFAERENANLILATGASQFTFLKALQERDIDWQRIRVFHLDEYKGLPDTHPASFRRYLKERILDEVGPKEVHLIAGDASDLASEMERYASLLEEHPTDVACIGIGENGHIAFNDPPVADFEDPRLVKVVALDEACRNQQLGEGWFPSLENVPQQAVTLTVPAIMRAKSISCVVPDTRKAEAIRRTLFGPIETECPASILRRHPDCTLFLDWGSAAYINTATDT